MGTFSVLVRKYNLIKEVEIYLANEYCPAALEKLEIEVVEFLPVDADEFFPVLIAIPLQSTAGIPTTHEHHLKIITPDQLNALKAGYGSDLLSASMVYFGQSREFICDNLGTNMFCHESYILNDSVFHQIVEVVDWVLMPQTWQTQIQYFFNVQGLAGIIRTTYSDSNQVIDRREYSRID